MAKPRELSLGDWNEIVDAFHAESDRGAAVLAGSFAENTLGHYLRACMRDPKVADELFAPMGPLSSLSQRIAVAYAFGLISAAHYRDFQAIRRIRNHFAHHPFDATFGSTEIAKAAADLSMMDHAAAQHSQGRKRTRIAYLLTCGFVCAQLLNSLEK